jgi:hypothetical protein
MNIFSNTKEAVKLMLLIFVSSILGNAVAGDDSRTPLEKYQGAYLGAFLTCVMKQKIIYLKDRAEQKGVELDGNFGDDFDMKSCKVDGLSSMKKEYLRVLPMIKGFDGKNSLNEHYVHAVMHIKEIEPWFNEDEATYMERMNKTFRKSKELYVRFEITQP